MRWRYSRGGQETCSHCRIAYERKGEAPPCPGCTNQEPESPPYIEKFLRLMGLCHRQLRVGMDVVGFDWSVVIRVAAAMRIAADLRFFRLLAIYENEYMTILKERHGS